MADRHRLNIDKFMEKIKLAAKTRTERGSKSNQGRSQGLIPAVVYGKGIPNKSLWVNNLDFLRLIKSAGESSLIELGIDGKENNNVIIYDSQKDPVSEKFTHIDFFQVRMDEKIETEVELVFVGESAAVKEASGVLVKNMDKIGISCLPGDLPASIEVDISPIRTFDDYIYVKDLKVGRGVEIKLDPEAVVALVAPPRSDEELESLEQKVEADVTKVEGMVKEVPAEEGGEGEVQEPKAEEKGKEKK